ncbi:tRNA threonylcarbamoyladenosine dehydratase [Massilia genomosp. 1]|uniref:tRNA cyclic N6-threonylcarbamoyladenosine(37) synthase TcdA n=1 Tax=Massilia genomosp. 1 TaxID=2609280 RepID=A0ABX0MLE8_9BURK|nr:tRNA threonylcarbamoyladenosine dehydratase [Massilia genomosp. 1]NHZ62892.1 tRNA cyclic N6-threonylcarbamoyladenosine(37) synthase TcdA [Massilia genomosp. 1]
MHTITIPSLPSESDEVDFGRRFGGIGRLYGDAALARFRSAHVCVIGVGGVGSWIVEALARSAIGQLTLIDLDNVAESNINRQIQALTDTVGQAKIGALAERIAQINPFCKVKLIEEFIDPGNLDQMIGAHQYDYVVDAIDNVKAKAALIAYCRDHQLPMVIIGSAGGKTDPTRIELRDLSRTEQEPLLKLVRKRLRNDYGFPRSLKTKFNVDAVFSMEPLRMPEGENCELDGDGITGLNCAGFGSSMVVTATFGMVAAGHVLRRLADGAIDAPSVQAPEALLS